MCVVGVWVTLKKRKGVPSQSSSNPDYNQKLTRIAWVTGSGCFLLPILAIYLYTIVPLNQEFLFPMFMPISISWFVPISISGVFYFLLMHKANHYEQVENKKSKQPQ
ncbi:MAG: hypothetical protein AMDU5_GPLC00004G0147 [Thermoplasmatales archaeon Gpl]|nr:MAG: hypothetical protein AMDU5_GPLC00004G0147 [Thermoplasmatales archaeon Gpl]